MGYPYHVSDHWMHYPNHEQPFLGQVFSVQDVYAMDGALLQVVPHLMSFAASAAFQALQAVWPNAQHLVILVGPGNNGGDGYTMASLALEAGLAVTVLSVAAPQAPDARTARAQFKAQGGVLIDSCAIDEDGLNGIANSLPSDTVLVDALFGIGLSRTLGDEYCRLIHWANSLNYPILSLDVPSGLCAESGNVFGAAIKATMVLVYLAYTPGLFLNQGLNYWENLALAPLSLDAELRAPFAPCFELPTQPVLDLATTQPVFDVHKGARGKVTVVGGSLLEYAGAPCLAAHAAVAAGAGYVTLLSAQAALPRVIAKAKAHIMTAAIETKDPKTFQDTVQVIGPGTRGEPWVLEWLAATADVRQIIDAGALQSQWMTHYSSPNTILTPHPGEAARLLETTASEVQANRLEAVQSLVEKSQATVVLKGAGTLIHSPEQTVPYLIPIACPKLATAGTGDVLAGFIGGLWASGAENAVMACLKGAYHHAKVAQMAETRVLNASELVKQLARLPL